MALTSTSKQISSLKINKVPSEAIYAKMVAQNLINDDELYLISGEADAITGVKGNKETTYRTGNINLTPADIGALPDTTEIPVVPTNISAFENDAGYLTQHQSLTNYPKKTELANVATSGNYNDLKNKPTIPSVGNGTLTIQKNGTSAGTFTANATTNKTINITVPTKVSELTDDVVKGKYLSLTGGTMTANGKITMDSTYTPSANGDVATKKYVDDSKHSIVGTSTTYPIYIGSSTPASGTAPLLWIDTTSSTGTFKYRTSTTGTWKTVPVAWS